MRRRQPIALPVHADGITERVVFAVNQHSVSCAESALVLRQIASALEAYAARLEERKVPPRRHLQVVKS